MGYKEDQKKYRQMYKEREKFFWLSKLPPREINGKTVKSPLTRGRTYIKPKEEVTNNGNME